MIPVLAIVGRPNVGKSTLFNYLTQSRAALVADMPGVTRDRLYGEGRIGDRSFIVIDTGGLIKENSDMNSLTAQQTKQAVSEADLILFLVDARAGLTADDEEIAKTLRQLGKSIKLVVNKVDDLDPNIATAEFHRLGLGEPHPIAAAHGRGITPLITDLLLSFPVEETTEKTADEQGIKLAIVGRPNAGKSTLVNRMLGEERVVVYDEPGTTRDSIFVPLERRGKRYTLIDTAGVRRRGKITDTVEKFSVVKTLQAIEAANVVLLVIDARESIAEQDLHLLGFILDAGKALVIAVNKWDGLPIDQRDTVRRDLDRRLVFVDFATTHFISALHGTGVGELFPAIDAAYASAMKKLATPQLTRILERALVKHQPPLVHGRRIKLRYAHPGGNNPPTIIIHGNQTESLPDSYKRYLAGEYRKSLKLVGTPVLIELKSGENPYAGRKNVLTSRQRQKRQRMMRHVKKK